MTSFESNRVADRTEFDYSQVTPELMDELAEDAIQFSDAIAESIVSGQETTKEAVLDPLHEQNDTINLASSMVHFMANVHPNEAVRDAAKAAELKLDRYDNDLSFREDIYQKFKAFAESDDAKQLDDDEVRFVADTLRGYHLRGFDFDAETRERIHQLSGLLSDAGTEFRQNINRDNTEVILSPDELAGLPESYMGVPRQDDNGNYHLEVGKYPQLSPFLRLAEDRSAREKVLKAKNNRAVDTNSEVLQKIVNWRQEMAGLMGYDSWADYKLEDRMAGNVDAVKEMYKQLLEPLAAKSEEEVSVMADMLHEDGYEGPLQSWDIAYYANKLRKERYQIDQEKVAEYFPLDAALEGLFTITGETFGLKYRPLDVPTWHDSVRAYAIHDAATGEEISHFYLDLFPRDGKYTHAAATNLVAGRQLPDGSYRRPESAVMANFTEPTDDKPALLKHHEVSTLFHEFGHVLHQTLTRARLAEQAGTRVERDFVEAPSQIMEHWVREPEVLKRFARHYQTGEPIPEELVNGLVAGEKLNIGLNTMAQMSLGMFDMAIHDSAEHDDLGAIWRGAASIRPIPTLEEDNFFASFGHIMGAYDAGYYGYLWSEVYGDDMFGRFKQEGLTSLEVGMDYRKKILERGGTVDAIDMLRDFLGREPDNRAFLRELGIS